MLDYAGLKAKHQERRHKWPLSVSLRVHRALSWIGRAEEAQDDPDARFIFLWIAFNAAYANEKKSVIHSEKNENQEEIKNERDVVMKYFYKLNGADEGKRIYAAFQKRFNGPMKLLMTNPYLFSQFWCHHNGIPGFGNWEREIYGVKASFDKAYEEKNVPRMLSLLFGRLYVLRNQIIHGGATWNSNANRPQIRDGVAILEFLIPIFIDIMMENPKENYWGKPFYSVVERNNSFKPREERKPASSSASVSGTASVSASASASPRPPASI